MQGEMLHRYLENQFLSFLSCFQLLSTGFVIIHVAVLIVSPWIRRWIGPPYGGMTREEFIAGLRFK